MDDVVLPPGNGRSVPGLTGLPGRCLVMGILNVTPDSFSDGGRWADADAAVAHGLHMLTEGADLIDVGGESTRPGAQRVPAEEELRRVLPVVRQLSAAGALVSIDTMRAEVAHAAVDAGARMVNDVSGGLADPELPRVVAAAGVPFVAMHWRGPSDRMDSLAAYHDVVSEVIDELSQRLEALVSAGIDPDKLIVDPGLGFAKTAAHSWQLLAAVDRLIALGPPVLIGASRKRFLAPALTGSTDTERDDATAAVTALVAAAGAWAVRVHDVRRSVVAVRVAAAVKAAAAPARAAPVKAAVTS